MSSRQYRCLAPALTLCTMLAIGGTAHAARTITPDASPTAAETAAARRALPGDFKDAERIEHHPPTFTVGLADLNGDGKPDLIIHFDDPLECGMQDCSAYALLAVPGGYSTHPITLALFPPGATITVLDSVHHGMRDLRFDDSTYVFRWTGTAYRGAAG